MKKALAILMVLAAITGVVFADVADIAVSGVAKLTWGVDFDNNNATGFKQGNEWKISIPLLAKKTFTTKSTGDAYAEINIVDAQYYINGTHDASKGEYRDDVFTGGDKKIDKVTAKLVFGNVYATISNGPSFYSDNANIWAPIKNDVYFDSAKDPWLTGWVTPTTTSASAPAKEGRMLRFKPGVDGGAGTKIGYKTSMFDVGVKIASPAGANYETDTVNRSVYAVGVDATVMPSDMISVAATANYLGWKTNADSAGDTAPGTTVIGAKVVVTPMANLSVNVGVDASSNGRDKNGERAFSYDAVASAKYKFAEAGVYYASVGTPAQGHDKDGFYAADLAAYAKFTDGGMVPNVTAWVTVMANHLLTSEKYIEDIAGVDSATVPLAFGAGASYKYMMGDVNYVKPFGEIFGQTMSVAPVSSTPQNEKGTEIATAFNLGVEYGLFTNAILTAKYTCGATNDDLRDALINTGSRSDKGDFALSAKITY